MTRSCFRNAKIADTVNLEKALLATSRLGGHLVSGHVDGIGIITKRYQDMRSWRYLIEAPDSLARYIAEKGSITIDGISLTVNSINSSEFGVNIVPHTLQSTSMSEFKVGTEVNLEVDLIARYLERLLKSNDHNNEDVGSITESMLRDNGFVG
jgi:riboflavin synthase